MKLHKINNVDIVLNTLEREGVSNVVFFLSIIEKFKILLPYR